MKPIGVVFVEILCLPFCVELAKLTLASYRC